MFFDSFFRTLFKRLWYDENDLTEMQQKKKVYRVYQKNRPWHNVIFKNLDTISTLMIYLVFTFLLLNLGSIWEDTEIGKFDSILVIIILLLIMNSIIQVLQNMSTLEEETIRNIKILLSEKSDIESKYFKVKPLDEEAARGLDQT